MIFQNEGRMMKFRSSYAGELLAGILVASVVLLFASASIAYAQASGLPPESKIGKALPGEACRIGPTGLPKRWTEPEKWAWKEICEGRAADFNKRSNEPLDPQNPQHDRKWSDGRRTLSSDFLEAILLHEPFRSAIPDRGVEIVAAYFERNVNLYAAVVHRPLVLQRSFFNASVSMNRVKVQGAVSFKGSKFTGQLNMDSASIRGALLMRQAEFAEVILRGVEIGGQVVMDGSTFNGKLNMDSASIRGALLMRQAEFAAVRLRGAEIGGQVAMDGSTFNGKLNMDSASIRGALLMRQAEFAEVDLRGAEIGGQIAMDGSTFNGKLNMDSVTIGAILLMNDAVTFATVNLRGAEIGGQISLKGSTFNGKLNMNSMTVGASLLMHDGATFAEVDLRGAEIGDQVGMDGSTFNGPLNMDSVMIRGGWFMWQAKFAEVDLRGAEIGGRISMPSSTFNGKLNMGSVTIGTSLLMHDGATFAEVNLAGAEIGGQVGMDGSTFNGPLNMDSVMIGASLLMRHAVFNKEVKLTYASVGTNLDARGAELGGLDLTATRVARELWLGSPGSNIKWKEYKDKNNSTHPPKLRLLNTTVGTLQDTKNTWPPALERDLDGFTYTRLGGLGPKEREMPFERGSGWFIGWLEKDKAYSPQPYRQLATVLSQAGYDPIADEIHFALQDRIRTHDTTPFATKVLLTMSWVLLGYGYKIWLALAWFSGLVVLGCHVVSIAPEGCRKSLSGRLFYSLESAVPLIDLTPLHQKFSLELTPGVDRYFQIHKIIGLVIVSVLIAGMTGLVT